MEPVRAPSSTTRRRFLAGSISAAPVVMSVASRPVLAVRDCASLQVAASHTTNPATSLSCTTTPQTGESVEFWMTNAANWPSPYNATAG
jgi:hypothetical protein